MYSPLTQHDETHTLLGDGDPPDVVSPQGWDLGVRQSQVLQGTQRGGLRVSGRGRPCYTPTATGEGEGG